LWMSCSSMHDAGRDGLDGHSRMAARLACVRYRGIREKPDSASQGSCDDPQVSWVLAARVFKKVAYLRSPNVQRFSTFREELVPLIYGRNP
jgi:hypothetical protein